VNVNCLPDKHNLNTGRENKIKNKKKKIAESLCPRVFEDTKESFKKKLKQPDKGGYYPAPENIVNLKKYFTSETPINIGF
jgi:hypothetical protein